MKKIVLLTTSLIIICSASFGQKPPFKSAASKSEDSIQYSLGVYMMQQLFAKTGFTVTNPTMFKKAIDDVIAKRPLMVSAATTENRLLGYQKIFNEEKGRQLEKMLMDKVKKETTFNSLPSGVYYTVVKPGKGGIRPTARDTVLLNVICTLPDGTVVDDTNKTKQSYMAITGEMIPGLKEVLYRMDEGAIYRAILPASQAYGQAGTLTIPPNSAVIYDIALISVKLAK
ncbi:MAG: FKBP-type peptidyl-prolyl cis-trans isomerase [Sediminibacterium sp.]